MSNTTYIKDGNIFSVGKKGSTDYHNVLPPLTFGVRQNPMTGQFFLEIIENMTLPPKVYGDTIRNAERIIRTFQSRSAGTGVLLTGEKGSGKTLLSKQISIFCRELGIPTIVINNPYCGEGFNNFIQSIEQPAMLMFDEFEKVYNNRDDAESPQEKLLTLFDGTYQTKKLFVLTSNDSQINYHMINRPGRIFYNIEYSGVDIDFIREYCEDNLINKNNKDSVCQIAAIFSAFNFDMLKALVEEMNRFDETAFDAVRLMNIKPNSSSYATYVHELYLGANRDLLFTGEGEDFSDFAILPDKSPLITSKIFARWEEWIPEDKNKEEGDWETKNIEFNREHIVSIDSHTGNIILDNGQAKLVCKKKQVSKFEFVDYSSF